MSGELPQIYAVSRAAIMAGMVTLAACDQTHSAGSSAQTPTSTPTAQPTAPATQVLPTQVINPGNNAQLLPQPGQDPMAQTTPTSPFLNGTQIAPPSGPPDIGSQARRYGGPPRPLNSLGPLVPAPADPAATTPTAAASRYGSPPSPIDDWS
jgi:hypothetical protein